MNIAPLPWPNVPLGELCRIELGSTPARKSAAMWDPDKKTRNVWLTIADLPTMLHAHAIDSNEYVSDAAAKKMRLIRAGTLLVSFKLTLGRLAYAGRDVFSNEAIASLLDIDERRLTKPFLYWALSVFDWNKAAEGDQKVKGKALNKAKLKRILIPLPPLEEQRGIVAVLDEAFEGLNRARAHAEANLQYASELFQSFLASELSEGQRSWDVAELNQHVRFIDYRGKTPPKTDRGIRLITAKNVKMGFIQREPEEFMAERAYEGWMTRGFPKIGDVLFTTEAPLANVAQLDTDEKVVIGQRLITMQPDQKILLSDFLKFALMSPQMQAEILNRGTGATVVGIKARLLKTVPLYYPKNIEDQRLISERCQRVYKHMEELRFKFLNKLQYVNDLRQSILQRTFAGELT